MNRPCRYSGCPNTGAIRGFCDAHESRRSKPFEYAHNHTSNASRSAPYDMRWRRQRLMHLRAHPVCVQCGQAGRHVDHIQALNDGGTHDADNLQTLCVSCHSRKTIGELIAKRRAAKAERNRL